MTEGKYTQSLITLVSVIELETQYASGVPFTNPQEHQGTAHKHSGIYTRLFKPSYHPSLFYG